MMLSLFDSKNVLAWGVSAFVVLLATLIFENFAFRRPYLISNDRAARELILGELVIGGSGIAISDGLKDTRKHIEEAPAGIYVVKLFTVFYYDRRIISEISLSHDDSENKIASRTVKVSVDSEFIMFADPEYVELWSGDEIEKVVAELIEGKRAPINNAAILTDSGNAGRILILLPGLGNDIYDIFIERSAKKFEVSCRFLKGIPT